ncbi:MAG: Lrp/AsnC ligand binding domain-containing protein, partial [Bacteroidota bacterium]|nr:Lrp/AsnC ligand binding domain-containing protein [Bacteroidota bacterium]
ICTLASTQNGRSRNHFWKLYQNNQEKLSYTTQAFVGIFLDKATHHPGAVGMLEEIPEVTSCYFTTGDWSLLIQLNCKDNNYLSSLLSGKIQNITGVLRTETYICLKQLINRQIPTDLV